MGRPRVRSASRVAIVSADTSKETRAATLYFVAMAPGEYDSTAARAEVEKLVDANSDAAKAKKIEGAGADGLFKLSKINHQIKKSIPHGAKAKADSAPTKIMSLSWGPNEGDQRMAVVDQGGSLFVWDTVKTCRMYGCIYPFAQCVAISPDETNPAVLVGGMRNATVLFKKDGASAKMKETKTWIAHDGYISSLHFLEGNKYISSGGDADARIFDLNSAATNTSLQTFKGHSLDCQSVKFARGVPAKNVFITCSSDKTVKMWDIRANKCVGNYETDSELNSCAFFPTGDLIACGGEKDKTYVFDVRAYKKVGTYARNNMKTASCEFSKSGRELFVGHDDGAIVVWDIFGSGENRAYANKIVAHTVEDGPGKVNTAQSRVQVLDVGPEGLLASGGFNGKVLIWGNPAAA